MHYVYVLKGKKKDFYIGYANDLKRRFIEHQRKNNDHRMLIYYEAYLFEEIARERERKLK